MRARSNRGLVATVLLAANIVLSVLVITSPAATSPAAATEGRLECWVVAHDGDFEIGWSGGGPAAVNGFVVERRTFGIYRLRATLDDGARGFADGPTHRSISADYRVSSVDDTGATINTKDCTPSNSPGLTCQALQTPTGYRVSWSGPVLDEAARASATEGSGPDVVVRRRVADGDPRWWRGRVANSASFEDGRSPTGSAHYMIEVRSGQRIWAMGVCGRAISAAQATIGDACESFAVSLETEGSTGLTVDPDGRVYHLGRVDNEPVLQMLNRDGTTWRTLASTAPYARSFFTAADRLYYIENDETGGRVQQIDSTTGAVRTALAMHSIDLALLVADDDTVFLRADDGVTGDDLWRFDPMTGDANLVVDLNGTRPARPARLVETADGSIYFTGFNGSSNRELFRYSPDGAAFQVVEMDDAAADRLQPVTDRNGALYFSEKGVGATRLDPATGHREMVFELHDEAQTANVVAAGPDGRLYFSLRSGEEPGRGRLVIFDPRTGRLAHPPFNSGGVVQQIEFATADRIVVTSQVEDGDRIEIVDLDAGTSTPAPTDDLPNFIWGVATSADGSTYFTGADNVYVFDPLCSQPPVNSPKGAGSPGSTEAASTPSHSSESDAR